MSDATEVSNLNSQVKALTDEKAVMKNQIDNMTQQFKILQSTLEAHKQALNDANQVSLNLRTNNILGATLVQELNGKIAEKDRLIESVNKQLADSNAKIAELDKPQDATNPQ